MANLGVLLRPLQKVAALFAWRLRKAILSKAKQRIDQAGTSYRTQKAFGCRAVPLFARKASLRPL